MRSTTVAQAQCAGHLTLFVLSTNTRRLCYYSYIVQGVVRRAGKSCREPLGATCHNYLSLDVPMYRSSCQKLYNCAGKAQNDYDRHELQSSSGEKRQFRTRVQECLTQPPARCGTWQVCTLPRCH